jgi:hypothetical protein
MQRIPGAFDLTMRPQQYESDPPPKYTPRSITTTRESKRDDDSAITTTTTQSGWHFEFCLEFMCGAYIAGAIGFLLGIVGLCIVSAFATCHTTSTLTPSPKSVLSIGLSRLFPSLRQKPPPSIPLTRHRQPSLPSSSRSRAIPRIRHSTSASLVSIFMKASGSSSSQQQQQHQLLPSTAPSTITITPTSPTTNTPTTTTTHRDKPHLPNHLRRVTFDLGKPAIPLIQSSSLFPHEPPPSLVKRNSDPSSSSSSPTPTPPPQPFQSLPITLHTRAQIMAVPTFNTSSSFHTTAGDVDEFGYLKDTGLTSQPLKPSKTSPPTIAVTISDDDRSTESSTFPSSSTKKPFNPIALFRRKSTAPPISGMTTKQSRRSSTGDIFLSSSSRSSSFDVPEDPPSSSLPAVCSKTSALPSVFFGDKDKSKGEEKKKKPEKEKERALRTSYTYLYSSDADQFGRRAASETDDGSGRRGGSNRYSLPSGVSGVSVGRGEIVGVLVQTGARPRKKR